VHRPRGSSNFHVRTWPPLAAGLALAVTYISVGGATLYWMSHVVDATARAETLALPWLAEGIAVGALLLGGTRLWPALVVASWVVWGVIFGDPPFTVTVDAFGEALSTVLIVRLLAAFGFHRRFHRFRDPLVLLMAATIGRAVAIVIDVTGLLAANRFAPGTLTPEIGAWLSSTGIIPVTAKLLRDSLHWTLNSIAGVVLVVPLMVSSPLELRRALTSRPLAFSAFLVLLALWSVAALALPSAAAWVPMLLFALMLVSWASVAFGVVAAAGATLVFSLVASAGFGLRMGLLAATGPVTSLEALWGFIAILAVTGLTFAALLAERRRDVGRLRALAERYRRMFRGNPCALWVSEPQGGRILMVNDEALHQYGYSESELLDMRVADLATHAASAGGIPAEPGTRLAGSNTLRHRSRDGKLIDIELISTPLELDGRPAELSYAVDVTDRNALRHRLLAAADLERRRLAQELHDGLGQVLTGLSLGAQSMALKIRRGDALEASSLDFVVSATKQATEMCQQLTRGVSPLAETHGDLVEALKRLPDVLPPGSGARTTVTIEVRAPLTFTLDRSEHLYRLARDAVTGALRHAQAENVRVSVAIDGDWVRLEINDDGTGSPRGSRADVDLVRGSMDLRAAAIGAVLSISPHAGGGTTVTCECRALDPYALPRRADTAVATTIDADAPPRRSDRTTPARIAGVAGQALMAVACFAGMGVTAAILRSVTLPAPMMAPQLAVPSMLAGISAAGLLLGGARLWLGIAAGTFAAALAYLQLPLGFAAFYALSLAIGALIFVSLMKRFGFSRAFDRWQDPLLLLIAASIGFGVNEIVQDAGLLVYARLWPRSFWLGAIAFSDTLASTAPSITPAFRAAAVRWWADSTAGAVLLVPLAVATPPLWRVVRERNLEAGIWLACVLCWAALLLAVPNADLRMPMLALALMLVTWAAVRLGVAFAALATFACSMAATADYALGLGGFLASAGPEGPGALWSFLGILSVTGLFITALLAERERIHRAITATAERHRQLFARDPHALWVHDRASGRILMVNPQTARKYGYSTRELLAMQVGQLFPNDADAQSVHLADGSGRRAQETRQRLKSGALIDVEVSTSAIELDHRPAVLCFAVDVTERNALRRSLIEAADRERRRLATELRDGLGRALADLDSAALRLRADIAAGAADPALADEMSEASRQATALCRRTAHGVSPLQASNGDLVDAVKRIAEYLPASERPPLRVNVYATAPLVLPLTQREHLYGLLREAVLDAANRGPGQEVDVTLELEPQIVRITVSCEGGSGAPRAQAATLMLLRASAMGARLWEDVNDRGDAVLVCECPQIAA
jgi:two-component system, LuxR family, sensor kinase FixL